MLAKAGVPTVLVFAAVCALGALVGAVNGSLVAYLRLPSIVVTLAMMIVLRDALRWITQGAWVQDLPPDFQWMGLSQGAYPFAAGALAAAIVVGARLEPAIYGRRAGCSMRPDRAATRRGSPA